MCVTGDLGRTLWMPGGRERGRGEASVQRAEPEEDLERAHERNQGRHLQDDSTDVRPRRRRSQPGVLLQADGEHEQRPDLLSKNLKCV